MQLPCVGRVHNEKINDSTVSDLKNTSKKLEIELIFKGLTNPVLNILSTRLLFLSVDPTIIGELHPQATCCMCVLRLRSNLLKLPIEQHEDVSIDPRP